jgi:hypothetical protein
MSNTDNDTPKPAESGPLDPNRETDCAVATKLGLKVVDKFWNCNIDPEAGYVDPLYYVDPDFKEGYTGIMYLRHPVYLSVPDWAELITFEDGTLGWFYEDGTKQVAWPPQLDDDEISSKFYPDRLVCYDLAAVPHYSENLNKAWQIVEFIHSKGYWTKLLSHYSPENNHQFMIGAKAEQSGWGWSPCDYSEFAETVPLAICKTFLKLKLEEEE